MFYCHQNQNVIALYACHCDFCLSHCSGVRVFCSKAWISFSSSTRHVFTILLGHNTQVQGSSTGAVVTGGLYLHAHNVHLLGIVNQWQAGVCVLLIFIVLIILQTEVKIISNLYLDKVVKC